MPATARIDSAALDQILKGPNGAVAREIQRRARNIQIEAKILAPKDTRALERNIVTRPITGANGEFTVRVIAGENLPDNRAAIQEFGHRAFIVRPRKAKALRFVAGGKVVFSAFARIPAYAGLHYMRRAAEAGRR